MLKACVWRGGGEDVPQVRLHTVAHQEKAAIEESARLSFSSSCWQWMLGGYTARLVSAITADHLRQGVAVSEMTTCL